MELGIGGKVALVAASACGLGLATAVRLTMEGFQVAICGLGEEALGAARARILDSAPEARVTAHLVDLVQPAEVQDLIRHVHHELRPIAILVTNSGGPPPGTFADASEEKWERAFHLTFLSAVRLIRAALPDMWERRWGRIINFTSRALREPIPNLMISNALHLAVRGMTKTLAAEVAPYGIAVNNVLPGPTATERQRELIASPAQLKSMSDADSRAEIIREYITGISLLVDGGAMRSL